MENKKPLFKTLAHCVVLLLFAVAALASSSSHDALKSVDDFVEGYNYGKSLVSDATDESENIAVDSIMPEMPFVADIN